ncbi:hypothetical protein SERLA73DRAFT_80617 [Serpula lacrymans var. lacrymans S7.3]|uniref:Uncharacterized protein n=1 Tax=Serpula lacrymans var. lacrymans (strain S7.3) TaxID=936435 RepID=F8QK13_SERL3|nr:hypothetical protein SERLA73DRAFT_80617 [Serpula lacrymans var. lacrymans S7.3]
MKHGNTLKGHVSIKFVQVVIMVIQFVQEGHRVAVEIGKTYDPPLVRRTTS